MKIHLSRYFSWVSITSEKLPDSFTWSERGTVCEYVRQEKLPIREGKLIHSSKSTRIDIIRCKGILLIRKQNIRSGKMTRGELQSETKILGALNHHHVVKLVGSYTQGKVVGMLLHPVADSDLSKRIQEIQEVKSRLSPKVLVDYSEHLRAFQVD